MATTFFENHREILRKTDKKFSIFKKQPLKHKILEKKKETDRFPSSLLYA